MVSGIFQCFGLPGIYMSSLLTLWCFTLRSPHGLKEGGSSFATSSNFDIMRVSPVIFFSLFELRWCLPTPASVSSATGGFASLRCSEPGVKTDSCPTRPTAWEKRRCFRKCNILLCGMDLAMGWDLGENLGGSPSNVQGGRWIPALPQPSVATNNQSAGGHWGTLLACQDFPWRDDREDIFLLLPKSAFRCCFISKSKEEFVARKRRMNGLNFWYGKQTSPSIILTSTRGTVAANNISSGSFPQPPENIIVFFGLAAWWCVLFADRRKRAGDDRELWTAKKQMQESYMVPRKTTGGLMVVLMGLTWT